MLHHSEHVARLANKRMKRYRRKLLVEGEPRWVDIEEFDSSDPVVEGMPEHHFARIAVTALHAGVGRQGAVGAADAYLFHAAELHRIAVNWLEGWRPDVLL